MTHNKFYINCVDFFPNPKKGGILSHLNAFCAFKILINYYFWYMFWSKFRIYLFFCTIQKSKNHMKKSGRCHP